MANKEQSHIDKTHCIFKKAIWFMSAKEKCEHNKEDKKQF